MVSWSGLKARLTALRPAVMAQKEAENAQLRTALTEAHQAFALSQAALSEQRDHWAAMMAQKDVEIAIKNTQLAANGLDGIPTTSISPDVIARACLCLGVRDPIRHETGSIRCGHATVTMADGSQAWLKVNGLRNSNRDRARQREIVADLLPGLPKPQLIRDTEWTEDDVFWRACLMTLAPSLAASRLPWWRAEDPAELPDQWFGELRAALEALRRIRSPWYVITPAEVREMITAYLGPDLPVETDIWHVTHGDLSWANVTAPRLMLLDWENWGFAPHGYGPGRLLALSVLKPELAVRVERAFADELWSPAGVLGLLAALAVVKQAIYVVGDVPAAFQAPIERLSQRVCRRLKAPAEPPFFPARDASTDAIKPLVDALPELYQPIFGHAELSATALRSCEDRLAPILRFCNTLSEIVGRSLRVLDLGSSQGYVSFRLAQAGHCIVGIDNCAENIALSNALRDEHPRLDIAFIQSTIDQAIGGLRANEYDIVLALSIAHHLCHAHGKETVRTWFGGLAHKVTAAVFELALATERAYWAAALPKDERDLLEGFAFVQEAGWFEQPSRVFRPLYLCTNTPDVARCFRPRGF